MDFYLRLKLNRFIAFSSANVKIISVLEIANTKLLKIFKYQVQASEKYQVQVKYQVFPRLKLDLILVPKNSRIKFSIKKNKNIFQILNSYKYSQSHIYLYCVQDL